MPVLTAKMHAFCEHYSVHRSASKAYEFAGYWRKEFTSSELAAEAAKVLKRDGVVLRLHEIATDSREAFQITAAQKKQWLKTVIEVALQKVTDPVTGKEFFTGDPRSATSAIAELNKMDGDLAVQQKHITGEIKIIIDQDDAEL